MTERYTRLPDGYLDTTTRLEWEAESHGPMSWQAAMNRAASLGEGWRGPTLHELFSLVDDTRGDPATTLPGMVSRVYWSSSSYAASASYAWYVNFYYGYVGSLDKADTYFVRCVRRGAWGSLGLRPLESSDRLAQVEACRKADAVEWTQRCNDLRDALLALSSRVDDAHARLCAAAELHSGLAARVEAPEAKRRVPPASRDRAATVCVPACRPRNEDGESRITGRDACRRRRPLDGADAQALEHALTITERERDALRANLAGQQVELATVAKILGEATGTDLDYQQDGVVALAEVAKDRVRYLEESHRLAREAAAKGGVT